jgi:hypothetical protein
MLTMPDRAGRIGTWRSTGPRNGRRLIQHPSSKRQNDLNSFMEHGALVSDGLVHDVKLMPVTTASRLNDQRACHACRGN